MYRELNLGLLSILLIPAALILVAFGIEKIGVRGKPGWLLKSVLALNTALFLFAAPASGSDKVKVSCYRMPDTPETLAISDLNISADWHDIKNAITSIERSMTDYGYSEGREEGTLKAAKNAINLMAYEGTISKKTAAVLTAYVEERWVQSNAMMTCYDMAAPKPDPAMKERDDILKQMYTLADLRASGKLGDEAYTTATDNLYKELADYIPKDERMLTQIMIMDLVGEVHDRSK